MINLLGALAKQGKFCTGCGACYNVCPFGAIEKVPDAQGFLYPQVDNELCTECGACTKVCPKLHPPQAQETPLCYAAMAEDDVRWQSSSGGMFTLLAEWVLAQGGVVYGAAMEKDYNVHHICVEKVDDLAKVKKSKYVQSDTEKVYSEIKMHLKNGQLVLFTGTPCQAAAARTVLGEDVNLFIADILCHGVPSVQMWRDYVNENFDVGKVETIEFRSKLNGWRSERLRVFYHDGTSQAIPWSESAYEEGFQRNISLRDGCEDCEFAGRKRQGDITMGDFWHVEDIDASWNDRMGTSLLLVNNSKGRFLLDKIRPRLKFLHEAPIDRAAAWNRLHERYPAHNDKDRFKVLYPGHTFTSAVMQCRHALYDIGLVGAYTVWNYGGELTHYALYRALTEMGNSVLMIEAPMDSDRKPEKVIPMFRKDPYPRYARSRYYPNLAEMKFLNLQCRMFVSGSDQMFNHNMYTESRGFMVQNFVTDNKWKIAYAASWGHGHIWGGEVERAEEGYFLRKFDRFSVREDVAVGLCAREYGVKATCVLDPVFICEKKNYEMLAKESDRQYPGKFCFVYILDMTYEHLAAVKLLAEENHLEIRAIADPSGVDSQTVLLNPHIITDPDKIEDIYVDKSAKLEDWIAYILRSEFVVTDSFHSVCLCIILNKQFLVHVNKIRGEARLTSLLGLLDLKERMVYTTSELNRKVKELKPIDYESVNAILQKEITKSRKWLMDAVEEGKYCKKTASEFDILDARCDRLCKRFDLRGDDIERRVVELERKLDGMAKALAKKSEVK